MDPLGTLTGTWLFSNLEKIELQALQAAGRMEEILAGANVLEKDKPNDSLWIVIEGEVHIRSSPTTRTSVATLRAGDVFGEMSWLDGQPASSWVVSGGAKLFRIPFKSLDAALNRLPDAHVQVLRKFAINLSYRLRG